MQIKLLDVVRLKDNRTGTVVNMFDDACMVEITDNKGHTLDIPIVKYSDIAAVTWHGTQQ